ncbi:nucleoid-associated protein [Ekhidna sp. To15]|uniref:nucleoid-associated protein n=1 Tax=Ekhidna sp. To15 TaxID=3395267 RepID=UPI003F5249C6
MIDYKGASVKELFFQKIEEEASDHHLTQNEFSPSEEEMLKNIFLKPFAAATNTYQFTHDVQIDLNVLYNLSREVNANSEIGETYKGIISHLRTSSRHPNIKEGELFIIRFTDIFINGMTIDGLGIFKVEKKDPFIETPDWTKEPTLLFKEGIGEKKLDKACLILFDEDPFTILAYDNNNSEAVYWKNDFINLDFKKDHVNNTNHFLEMTKSYITDQMPEEFEVSKTDQIDLLNKSIKYFKEAENFDKGEFELSVFGQEEEAVKSFRYFDQQYQEDMDLEIEDNFKIAVQSVKKQARIFKSVLKLDKNFHVYIHGNRELIERGVDSDGRKYYKIYYDNES